MLTERNLMMKRDRKKVAKMEMKIARRDHRESGRRRNHIDGEEISGERKYLR